MTRQSWQWIIGVCLCAGLSSGCAHSLFNFTRFNKAPADKTQVDEVHKVAGPTEPGPGTQEVISGSDGGSRSPDSPHAPGIVPPRRQGNDPVGSLPNTDAEILPDAAQEQEQTPAHNSAEGPPVKSDDPPRNVAQPAPPEEPLLVALAHLLKEDDQALAYLDPYDPATREWFLRVLPMIAGLTRKGIEKLEAGELANLQDQLQILLLELRRRASLGIDHLCYCEFADGSGAHKALPESHQFLPKCGNRPGELVLLYAELRNVNSLPRDSFYETRISSSITIHGADEGSPRNFYRKDFDDRHRPLRSPTPSSGCFKTYSFYVPACIPPGRYTLTLEVRDETTQPPRVTCKTLPFVVAAEAAATE